MNQTKVIDCVIDVLYRIIYEEAYSSIIPLSVKKEEFSKKEEAYALLLSYGVIENLILLNHYLDELAKKRVKKKVRILLLLALYEIEFMDNNLAHLSVNFYVNYAKKKYSYAKNFVNAILRSHLRKGVSRLKPERFEDYAVFYSHPLELANLFKRAYGEEKAIDIMRLNQTKPKLNLRVNLTKCDRDGLIENLKKEGVDVTASEQSDRCLIVDSLNAASISSLKAFDEGLFYIQDIASIILADALNISGDEKILDLCSAPGGKALALCEDIQRQDGKGTVTACDIFDKKLDIIRENAERLGLKIDVLKRDASILNSAFIDAFDIVLADVPCSGFGIIRKKSEIKYRKIEKNVESMIKLQEAILSNASKYVKIGGRLVYSTCTMNPEENEKRIEEFLRENQNYVSEPFESLRIQSDSFLQLFTSEENDGFFIAILKRIT